MSERTGGATGDTIGGTPVLGTMLSLEMNQIKRHSIIPEEGVGAWLRIGRLSKRTPASTEGADTATFVRNE